MTIKSTNAKKLTFKKVNRVLVSVLEYTGGEYVKGDTAYSLDNIVADSTQITQDDPETNSENCETRDEPIDETITLGKYQFAAQNADWQSELMEVLLGFTKDASGVVYAPASYVEKYVEIELQFGDAARYVSDQNTGGYKGSIVLPKVLLSSKATFENLKTSIAKMALAGTAYAGKVTLGTGGSATIIETPYYYSPKPVNVGA